MILKFFKISFLIFIFAIEIIAQIENVPIENSIYKFLDRMQTNGILTDFSSNTFPLSRDKISKHLLEIQDKKNNLTEVEIELLEKYLNEFQFEIKNKTNFTSFFDNNFFDDKEKFLFHFVDSNFTVFTELISNFETKFSNTKNFSALQYGFKLRGCYENTIGFYLHSTNGNLYGDKNFALEDYFFRSNFKLNHNSVSRNFDNFEGYIKTKFKNLEFQIGREKIVVGNGYSDKLIISPKNPFDYFKMRFDYKKINFLFLHGNLIPDSVEKENEKFIALHRVEFPIFENFNFAFGEMIIYQRPSIELAYLNPFAIYKTVEHSLQDKDNSIMTFDFDFYPKNNFKIYSSFLLDDIDFEKLGTNWWGNKFAYKFGIFSTNIFPNCDAVIEYTQVDPFTYSHSKGNNYTHNRIGIGSNLLPNSDEIFFRTNYYFSKKLNGEFSISSTRHSDDGGSLFIGIPEDGNNVKFLDKNIIYKNESEFKIFYEPILNYFIFLDYKIVKEKKINQFFSTQFKIEF